MMKKTAHCLFCFFSFFLLAFFSFGSLNVWAATVTAWTEATGNGEPNNYSLNTPYHSVFDCGCPEGQEISEAKVIYPGGNDMGVSASHMAHLNKPGESGEWDGRADAKVQWRQTYFVSPGSSLWKFTIQVAIAP